MSQYFYDGQIRRYITQMIRLLSNFQYSTGDGVLKTIPVTYGDITRQVAHIIRDNSENKIPSVPRMGVYMTGLELDRTRLSDSSYTSKVHIRERAYDSNNNEYLNQQGKNYTVERLMPTPYKLSVNADVWTSNTDQKLQVMEQILMLFNPSMEIQTTDNYVDWTSLSVVDLDGINFSNRSIPVGTESEIDVGSLSFSMPIYISPPAKVKRLGVIQSIIASIYNEDTGIIDLGSATPVLDAYDDVPKAAADTSATTQSTNADGTVDVATKNKKVTKSTATTVAAATYQDFDLFIMNDTAQLISRGRTGETSWRGLMEALPGTYNPGISQIRLVKDDASYGGMEIVGTVTVNPVNETQMHIVFDDDTLPTDTVLTGPVVNSGSIDYVIDPSKFDPSQEKSPGLRILLLGEIPQGQAWTNNDTSVLEASENDIVEWDGNSWTVVFDASSTETVNYITNLNTGIQYKWTGADWVLSYYGEYSRGTWSLDLEG